MTYQQIMQRTWQENFLFSVMLELTYRCNLNCFFCYNDVHMQGKRLGLDQYLVLLEDLQQLGTLNLTLTGGEPLANPDFFAIGSHARERGFVVRIKSNGHALSVKRVRRIQREIDPFVIEISLHGACAESHDRQTRVPGSFRQLMNNMQHMLDLGMRIKLNSTLTAWNEAEIDAMFDIASQFGVRLQFNPQVSPKDDGDQSPLSIRASAKAVAYLLQANAKHAASAKAAAELERATEPPGMANPQDRGAATRAKVSKHCGAGSSSLHVDPFGNVFPCVQWRRKIGNLHGSSIRDIWQHSQELKNVRLKTQEVKRRMDVYGDAGAKIGFCPGLAEELTGNPLELYSGARERLAIRIAIKDERR